jgi:hypothetical protein
MCYVPDMELEVLSPIEFLNRMYIAQGPTLQTADVEP